MVRRTIMSVNNASRTKAMYGIHVLQDAIHAKERQQRLDDQH
jgi:hypothetical protein